MNKVGFVRLDTRKFTDSEFVNCSSDIMEIPEDIWEIIDESEYFIIN